MRRLLCFLILLLGPAALGAAGPHPSLPAIGSLDGLGVNIHFTDAIPGEMEMIADAGFKWVRMDLTWAATERTEGEYNFAAYDRLVASLDQHGLRAVFILDYGNALYAAPEEKHPFTSRTAAPEFREAYAKWAAAAVSHFKDKGYLWEIWNEPNHGGFWKPEPNVADYAALAKAACAAIERAAPAEAIIGPATSTIDLAFLEECFRAGLLKHWCAVSVHPYRQQRPETVEEEYRRLRLLIHRYAPKDRAIPIVSGEWGYSTAWPSLGKDEAVREKHQGAYVARQFLTNIANDIPLSIWYDWRDDGEDPKESEHRFGLVRRRHFPGREPAFDPKPAYLAVKTLTTELAGLKFSKPLTSGSADWQWLFAGNGRLKIVRHGDSGSGNPGSVEYIGQPSSEAIRVAAAWDRLPLEVVVQPDQPAALRHSVRNPLDRPLLLESPERVELAPRESRSFQLQIPPTRQERADQTVRLSSPGLFDFTQKLIVLGAKPLRLVALAPVGGRLPARIENLSGDTLEGSLELTIENPSGKPQTQAQPMALQAGQTEQAVVLSVPEAPRSFTAHLRLREGPGASRTPLEAAFHISRMTDFDVARKESYSVWSDGDAAVSAQVQTSFAPAPARLFDSCALVLRLSYAFAPGWRFAQVTDKASQQKPMAGEPKSFGLWVHSDGRGCTSRIRFADITGQMFQADGPKLDWKGWRHVSFPMQPAKENPAVHWGGANDGVIHYPIKWDTLFLLDNTDRQKIEGEVFLSSPALFY